MSRAIGNVLRMISVVLSLCAALVASAQRTDTFITIDYPGATVTDLNGINDSGEIVGLATLAGGRRQGFRYNDGVFTDINYAGALRTEATAINSQGEVAGFFQDAGGQFHGFVLNQHDTFTVYDYPDATTGTFALGINPFGTLVGEFKIGQVFGQQGFAFIYRGGEYEQFVPIGSVTAMAFSINPLGDVVGAMVDAAGRQSGWLLDSEGEYTLFSFPGATATNPRGINSSGEVVGVYLLGPGVQRAFTMNNGVLKDFTYPGATSTRLLAINDCGHMVGTYNLPGDPVRHGFLLAQGDPQCK